ncbi:RagB/SusD family nutrient uptake outer membrane protein [Ohtaekwangia koreensis]|uniref:Starch-binding associating with outer membrane n=1 Tax=Ohtaekwangia koreensis TaxID=688867 RepID=A0A1T5JN58_9BACT|nr:RagB/SusD family nutrient uptake outer membrane protein [Ohtaekwangia koreensis]SKC52712.1 Starch-binding associating with outer membrane [Ohtaekwangia koreensis]
MKLKYSNKKTAILVLMAAIVLGPIACKESFLEVPVTGELQEGQITNQKGVEGLLIGAYSVLNGRGNGWHSGASNWMWGSIRGGDANKGTNAGDFNAMNPVQRFEVDAVNGEVNGKWLGSFEGVNRANNVLYMLRDDPDNVLLEDIAEDVRTRIIAEARFLRGHYYFELKKNFNNVPWVDETTSRPASESDQEIIDKSNIPNNVDIWPKIEADMQFAYDNLPATQSEVGRANKWAAGAYLGKILLYEASWPDNDGVIVTNPAKYTQARTVFADVITNGTTTNGLKYALLPNFEDVFKGEKENHSESVFAFQAAAGTGDINNTNQDLAMNYPYNTGPNGPGECCGFFAPSFDLVNSYRTDDSGLPLLDNSYRDPSNELADDQGIKSDEEFTADYTKDVDPRLDLTIGRRYVQFLDWMPHPGFDWIRDQSYAGPFTQKKYSYRKSDKGKYQDGSSWTPGYHSINFMIIRFSDVLLMAAEAEIEGGGDLALAVDYINMVRDRAQTSTRVKGRVTGFGTTDGKTDYKKPIMDLDEDAASYNIGTYGALSLAEARAAVRFERKLELALEGQRFYDLIRWGIAVDELNDYLDYDGGKLTNNLGGAAFSATDQFLPIPQRQIDLQGSDVLKQNKGY